MATDQVHARRSLSVYIPSCHPLMSIESPFDTIHPLLLSLVVRDLGYVNIRNGIKPQLEKVSAILALTPPKSVKHQQS